jgi:transcriptional regulator with XRE-family HTH domain
MSDPAPDFVRMPDERIALRPYLGLVIKQRRTAKGLKPEDFSLSRSSFYDVESGKRWPQPDTLKTIANKLRTTPDELVAAASEESARSQGSSSNGGDSRAFRTVPNLNDLRFEQTAASLLPPDAARRLLERSQAGGTCNSSRYATHPQIRRLLTEAFVSEAHQMLRKTDVFDIRNVIRTGALIGSHDRELPRHTAQSLHDNLQLFKHERQKPNRHSIFSKSTPVKVSLPGTLYTSLLIFEYLKTVCGLNLEITCTTQMAKELEGRILKGVEADLVALPLTSAMRYLRDSTGSRNYSPAIILPRGSQRLAKVGRQSARDGRSRPERALVPGTCRYTTGHSYLHELHDYRLVDTSRLDIEPCPLDSIYNELASPSDRSLVVLWFPHNVIAEVLYECDFADNPLMECASKESLLLVAGRFTGQSARKELFYWLSVAYRELSNRLDLVTLLSQSMLGDRSYIDFLVASAKPLQ